MIEEKIERQIIQASQGTRAVMRVDNVFCIGEHILGFVVYTKHRDDGELWPDDVFITPISLSGTPNLLGVMHPDGSIDFITGENYASLTELNIAAINEEL